jgi:FtsZ-binding cell division protein ZapB
MNIKLDFAMQGKLSPYFIDITKDACLKSFWLKRTLRNFLNQNHITNNALAHLSGMTKREYLDWLFVQLLSKKNNKGHRLILEMARNLAAQNSFPDLQNHEDSEIKIKQAVDAVNLLRQELAKLNGMVEDKKQKEQIRKEAEERRRKNISSQQTLEQLNERLTELSTRLGTQKAGYDFQVWFYDLVDYFEILCKRPYVVQGRQIDGSLTLDGTSFLVELKFTKDQAGATYIDTFKSKVESKADNTMGIMVSISGYSSIAITEASGKRTPLILLDHRHLYHVLGSAMTLPDVISRVKRHAAQTAEAYLAVEDFGK